MSVDIQIRIHGTVNNPEAIFDLANAAAAEGFLNFTDGFDRHDFRIMLDTAAAAGSAVTLTKRVTTHFFEDVRKACQAAGLSYVAKYGHPGAEDFSEGFSWVPGMKEEFTFHLVDNEIALKASDLRDAASDGDGSVITLLNLIEFNTRVGKIEIEPGFAEAYDEYAGPPQRPRF